MNIGNVIYKLRNCRGMTEETLAEALKVTKETVTRWENDVETPDIVIKVNPERADLIETMEIEGRKCLVIAIDDHVEVNGVSVRL